MDIISRLDSYEESALYWLYCILFDDDVSNTIMGIRIASIKVCIISLLFLLFILFIFIGGKML